MNFANGKIISEQQGKDLLERLESEICSTMSAKSLSYKTVVSACGKLAKALDTEEILQLLTAQGLSRARAQEEIEKAAEMLSAEYLTARVEAELTSGLEQAKIFTPYGGKSAVKQSLQPLGVLFHIAAGNMDALPVYSVIEGLLTGNMNILKLPGGDGGLSVYVLQKLTELEPQLIDYIYVFGFPSSDTAAMQKMAELANAVIVWGGDEAVSAVRALCPAQTQIIEWGHKLSFGYVTKAGAENEAALRGFAENIALTNQLYCNSCQGLFYESEEDLDVFAQRFFEILKEEFAKRPMPDSIYLTAQKTLLDYTQTLCANDTVLSGGGCSVYVSRGTKLTSGNKFGNCFIRPMPRQNIIGALRSYRGHLQTVGLACAKNEEDVLCEAFFKAGAVRITSGRLMSETYCAQPHDGQLPLCRYVKITSTEFI